MPINGLLGSSRRMFGEPERHLLRSLELEFLPANAMNRRLTIDRKMTGDPVASQWVRLWVAIYPHLYPS
jgi:hypothetical protein